MPEPTQHFGYVCIYKGQRWEVYARTQLEARDLAVKHFKVRKGQEHKVSAVLAGRVTAEGFEEASNDPAGL